MDKDLDLEKRVIEALPVVNSVCFHAGDKTQTQTLWVVKSYFFKFLEEKKLKKNRKKKCLGAQTPQRMRRFPCLQDCLPTLTCHLASPNHY
jgi:hypothetical protein